MEDLIVAFYRVGIYLRVGIRHIVVAVELFVQIRGFIDLPRLPWAIRSFLVNAIATIGGFTVHVPGILMKNHAEA